MTTFIEVSDGMAPLEKSIFIARHINKAMDILRPLVYQVWKDELWKDRFSSFGEYVESPEGLGKSQGYASKLKKNEQFRLDSGLSPEQIDGLDYECLYLAINGGGTPEEIVAKAKTLTRAELRAERDEHTPCFPHTPITICGDCGMKL